MDTNIIDKLAGQLSLKQKMIGGFSTMLVLIGIIVSVSYFTLTSTSDDLTEIVSNETPLMLESMALAKHLNSAEAAMGYYLLSSDPARREQYLADLQASRESLATMRELATKNNDEETLAIIASLETGLDSFASFQSDMFGFVEMPLTNMPALQLSTEKLNTAARAILQNASSMIMVELEEAKEDSERVEMLAVMQNMRYVWARMLNEVRGYLAFRQPAVLDSIAEIRDTFLGYINTLETEYADMLTFEEEDALAQIRGIYAQYEVDFETMVKIHSSDNWRLDAFLAKTEMQPILSELDKNLEELILIQQQQVNQYSNALITKINGAVTTGILVAIAALILSITGYLLMQRTIQGPLSYAMDIAGKVSGGDLRVDVKVSGRDEFAQLLQSLKDMINNLANLVQQVQESGIQVTSSSTRIAATAKQQETTLSQQAVSTNEIMATANQINASSGQLSDTMEEVSTTTENTASSAQDGKSQLTTMEKDMDRMADATRDIASKLEVLDEKATNISSVVTTITKIADQTNLLSLNAAIEAEKAGEYGLGFAVVAKEIRRLADQTAVATWDIEQMVREMQEAVSTSVRGVETFSDEVRHGADRVRDIGHGLADILERIQVLKPRFQSVRTGMHSHISSADQINQAIQQLNESAQQSVESIRDSTNAISQLNDAAQLLHNGISIFKVGKA
ncbi:MAG: HAMP domain-containing methyl-accepting chemotaxis protein [bacterium]